jgi:hypothetical protein
MLKKLFYFEKRVNIMKAATTNLILQRKKNGIRRLWEESERRTLGYWLCSFRIL